MARWDEDEERRREAEEERVAAQRTQEAMVRYGATLGGAYIKYVYARASTFEEQDEQRQAFADAVVTALEHGTHGGKVRGILALLDSFEAKIASVARQASEADFLTRPIG